MWPSLWEGTQQKDIYLSKAVEIYLKSYPHQASTNPYRYFLTGKDDDHHLYVLPINVMLKDNADDIKAKVEAYHHAPIISKIIQEAASITQKYTETPPVFEPRKNIVHGFNINLRNGVYRITWKTWRRWSSTKAPRCF